MKRQSKQLARGVLPWVLGIALTAALLGFGLAGCAGGTTSHSGSTGSTASDAAVSYTVGASGPFHVAGNKILGANGQQYVEYGFVLYCLVNSGFTGCTPPVSGQSPGAQSSELDRIREAATYWHANTVRIQVAQEYLFNQAPYNATYLAALDSEIQLANSLGMVAIPTLQEESVTANGPPFPDQTSVPFWNFMANHYKNNPLVMFDLYNEPRLRAFQGTDWQWNIWRNGGTVDEAGPPAVHDTFVGDQALVNDIRGDGASNIIIAEGTDTDHSLAGLPKYALIGTNIAYGMEPGLNANDDTPAKWAANWGTLSDTYPIMMEAFKDWRGKDCNPDSPTLLPREISYLESKHLGMIVWALNSTSRILASDTNLEQPTSFQGVTTYQCSETESPTEYASDGTPPAPLTPQPNTVGPGQLILGFFKADSHPAPTGGTGSSGSTLPSADGTKRHHH